MTNRSPPRRSPPRRTTIVPGALAAVALALLLATPAQAALNGSKPYHASHPYLKGLGGPEFILASGELDAVLPGTQGSFGFFSQRGADLDGLSKVCWSQGVGRHCQSGELSLHVAAGGSFGLKLPGGADASVHAGHALALFSDLGTTSDLNGLGLGKSLLAPAVDGEARLSAMAAIPDSAVNELSDGGGALAPLALGTVVEVRDAGGAVVATVHDKVDPLTFAGHPSLSPVQADLLVVPFAGAGADAHFRQASQADARKGLDLERINSLFRLLSDADSSGQSQPGQVDQAAFGPFQDAAAALFGGAVLRVPTDGNSSVASTFGYARTPQLEVKGTPAGGLAWSGRATLEVRDGHVVGGPTLYGWTFLALPWWGWALWALGIAAFVTRLVAKPPKQSERWDRWKWIGWLVGIVAAIAVFVFWDGEMRHVLGLSLLTIDWSFSGAAAQVFALVAVFQLTTLGYLSFSTIAPLRLLLKNGSRLLGQGTFMGLTGAIAALLGYLIGFGTLRSSLDLIVSTVLKGIGS